MNLAIYCISTALFVGYMSVTSTVAAAALPNAFECIIKPSQAVNVASATEGLLAEVVVDRGDILKKGDLIAKLESSVEEAQLDLLLVRASNEAEIQSGEARYLYQSAKLKRSEQLSDKRVISVNDVELARAEANLAKADIEQAELNRRVAQMDYVRAKRILERRRILSPISGIVVDRKLSPGEYVHEQVHIVTVIQTDPLFVEAYLPISVYGTVKVGMTLTVSPETPINGTFPAQVVVVDQMIDAASGTFGVRLKLDNKDLRLPSGLRCMLQ